MKLGIHFYPFMFGLLFGLAAIYLFGNSRKIVVYPTPENKDSVVYRDQAGNCFRYVPEKTKCEKGKVEQIPVQTYFD